MPSGNADVQPPTAIDPASLPSSSSPSLSLVLATPEEVEASAIINSHSWSGPLCIEAYLRREKCLASQPSAQEGGLSSWILVNSESKEEPRNILSSCESWRKKAILARQDGTIEDVVSHGIGSVYCREEYRGKGYSNRMLQELRRKLESWQQEDGKKASFNVLYSDIGKTFYAKHGWLPYPSAHVTLEARKESTLGLPVTRPLISSDLTELCRTDEMMLRHELSKSSAEDSRTRIAFIPDFETMAWHHAREEFIASEVLDRTPEIKGAVVSGRGGKRTWCIWNRLFAKDSAESTLFILRIASETRSSHTVSDSRAINEDSTLEVAACLNVAQQEAYEWGLRSVEVWNPSPEILAGAQKISSSAKTIHRDTESISCLLWYGSGDSEERVEWVANEKYGWC